MRISDAKGAVIPEQYLSQRQREPILTYRFVQASQEEEEGGGLATLAVVN